MAWPTEQVYLEPYSLIMDKFLQTANKGRLSGHIGQGQVEELMNVLAHHETIRTGDPSTRQKSNVYNEKGDVIGSKEGPGRGLYQYELETLGGSGEGRVAMNRLYATLGGNLETGVKPENMPKWMNQYFSENEWGHLEASRDVDFSELNAEQQNLLFLADKLQDPKVKLSDIGVVSDAEWWSKYHHKGEHSDTTVFSQNRAHYLNNR